MVISLPYIFQVLYVLCFTRPIYQVSVYRTIGPLVSWSPTRSVKCVIFFVAVDVVVVVDAAVAVLDLPSDVLILAVECFLPI